MRWSSQACDNNSKQTIDCFVSGESFQELLVCEVAVVIETAELHSVEGGVHVEFGLAAAAHHVPAVAYVGVAE
jgi:hypothetical protein